MKLHPLAKLFPPMTDSEFSELVAHMKVSGQQSPIVTLDGMILDGHHRFKACQKLNLKPIFRELDFLEDPLLFVIGANMRRRHLTESQKAMVAAEIEGMKHGGDRTSDRQVVPGPLDRKPVTRQQAADSVGVSFSSVTRAARIKREAPEKVEAIKRGETTVKAEVAALKKPKKEKLALVLDRFGHEIPEELQADWDLAIETAKRWLAMISKLKCELEDGFKEKSRIFARLDNNNVADLKNLYSHFKDIEPYTVCPYCSGHKPTRCDACKKVGWLSKSVYDSAVPREIKAHWSKD